MKKNLLLIALICGLIISAHAQQYYGSIWAYKMLQDTTCDTIYSENAPDSNTASVVLRIWSSVDTIYIGNPVDLIFLTDNSNAMGQRSPGDRDWVSPNKIQATYNMCNILTDTFGHSQASRNAHIRFCGVVDTPIAYTYGNYSIRPVIDTCIDGSEIVPRIETGTKYPGSALYKGIYSSIKYAINNYRPKAVTAIFVITNGEDDASGDYFKNYVPGTPNLGSTPEAAADSVLSLIDSIQQAGQEVRIFIFDFGPRQESLLDSIANKSDGGKIYIQKSDDYLSAVRNLFWSGPSYPPPPVYSGVQISPTTPLVIDVLGPNIHYVPGSYFYNIGTLRFSPILVVDTVNSLTRLSFYIDTIKNGDYAELMYDISALPDSNNTENPTLMRLNNAQEDDSVNYSLLQYKSYNDSLVLRGINKNYIWVKQLSASIDDFAVNKFDEDIQIFPNPFNPSVTITIPNTHTGQGLMQIYDIGGKTVYQSTVIRGQNIVWDASGISSGVYLLKVIVGDRIYSRKLILQR